MYDDKEVVIITKSEIVYQCLSPNSVMESKAALQLHQTTYSSTCLPLSPQMKLIISVKLMFAISDVDREEVLIS